QSADGHRRHEPDPRVAGRQGGREAGDRAHQHHPLDAEIQEAGALGEDLADRREQQHGPRRDAAGKDEPEVHQPPAPGDGAGGDAAGGDAAGGDAAAAVTGTRRSIRTRYRTRTSATIRVNRMIPWIIAGTPDGWISRPARISAPNRIAATITRPGRNFAR